jgi:hypothetical protein
MIGREKVLIVTGDALFGAKLYHELSKLGIRGIQVSEAATAEGYLDSGEISLIIVEADWGLEEWKNRLAGWSRYKGLKFIICGDRIPIGLDEHTQPLADDCRLVEKSFLLGLAGDILREFTPELLDRPGILEPVYEETERRRSARVEKSLRFYFAPPGDPTAAEVHSRTVNISTTGARIVSDISLSPDESIEARILLPYFSEMIPLKARVVWSEVLDPDRSYSVGLFFDRIDDSDRFNLINFLSRDSF